MLSNKIDDEFPNFGAINLYEYFRFFYCNHRAEENPAEAKNIN